MRLGKIQQQHIKASILELRPSAEVFLFGSRTDNQKKGGDIDILILDHQKLNISEIVKIERSFWKRFGEQKIDLVCFPPNSNHPFKAVALSSAVAL